MTGPAPGAGPAGGPPAVTIRPATADDVPDIHRIEKASFSDPWTPGAFRAMLAQPAVLGLAAERDGALVGYALAVVVGDEAELANIAVAPGARGQGVGRTLLDALLDALRARGGATVFLEVRDSNEAAQALYRSRGFVSAGRRKGYYRRPTEDALVMRRDRDAAGAGGGGADGAGTPGRD